MTSVRKDSKVEESNLTSVFLKQVEVFGVLRHAFDVFLSLFRFFLCYLI